MVLRVADLGPDHDKIGFNSRKKHLHPRTEEGTFGELERNKKKVKKEISETEADSCSCFVALVTTSNLQRDALNLPKDFTTSNGYRRECRKIILTDKGERAWSLDLSFNESTETFYISRGWRCFCNENSKKSGGFFIFNLVGNGEIPVLSFCLKETKQKSIRIESLPTQLSSEEDRCPAEKASKKSRVRCYDSTSPSQNRFVTLTPTHFSLNRRRQYLPPTFVSEYGVTRHGAITLVGKNGSKWPVNLMRNGKEMICLGKGWIDFVNGNDLKVGESFKFELISENATLVLRLLSTESSGECSKESSSGEKTSKTKNNSEYDDSTSPSENRFATLTPTPASLIRSRQVLPLEFMSENDLTRLGKGVITLFSRDGTKWFVTLRQYKRKMVCLGKGWRDFANRNGLKVGESFTLELIWKNATPMLRLLSTESTRKQGECSKAKNKSEEKRDEPSSPFQNRFVTLTLTPQDVRECKLNLPIQFMRNNGINKLGKMTLLGEKRKKWFGYLLSKDGNVAMGSGWKRFCEANGVKIGESFTLEFISEKDTNCVFKFCSSSGDC